jgi:hypothetical protein
VSVATRENLPRDVLRRRLLLCLLALGTNMGIRQMAATGEHEEDEGALRRVPESSSKKSGRRCRIGAVVFVAGMRPPTRGGGKAKEPRS